MRKAMPAEREAIRRLTDGVAGFLSEHEALYLLRLAAQGRGDGAIVEIGSYHGKSTVLLAHASRGAGREKVVAIDPHLGGAVQAFHDTLARAGVGEHVTPVVETSDVAAAAWRGPVRFLWIDGSHVYEQVRRDFLAWTPWLVDGGIVAFHDTYEFAGVRRVIDEDVARTEHLVLVGLVDTIAAFRKVSSPDTHARVQATLMRWGRSLYARRSRVHLRGELRIRLKTLLRFVSETR